MNWKKILLFAAGSGLAGGLVPWLQGVTSGHAVPFTFGTVGVPALLTAASSIIALFTKRPQE